MQVVGSSDSTIKPLCGLKTLSIPLEVAISIFSYLKLKEIYQVQLVCKEWKCISDENFLWRGFCLRDKIEISNLPSFSYKLQYYNDRMERKGATWTTLKTLQIGAKVCSMKQFGHYKVLVGEGDGCVSIWNFLRKEQVVFFNRIHCDSVKAIYVCSDTKFISMCCNVNIQWDLSESGIKITQIAEIKNIVDCQKAPSSSSIQFADGRRLTLNETTKDIVIEKLVIPAKKMKKSSFWKGFFKKGREVKNKKSGCFPMDRDQLV